MALIYTKYVKLEAEKQALQKKLDEMLYDPRVEEELAFQKKLHEVMSEFGRTVPDVINALIPSNKPHGNKGRSSPQSPRKLKVYRNPNTGETVKTRHGSNKVVRAWKKEYGVKKVESWLQSGSSGTEEP